MNLTGLLSVNIKRKTMANKFLVIPNLKKARCLDAVKEVTQFLHEKNCTVYCLKEKSEELTPLGIKVVSDEDFGIIDMALVFGGDGTFLESARRLNYNKIPLIGINLGHLGYLSEVEPSELKVSLQKLIDGKFNIENRIALEVTTDDGNKYLGFNEMVIHRSSLGHILAIGVDINNQRIESIRADGILVSTPTGSTAYNLSAGGPIILPSAQSLVITPICAHSLAVRSIVIGNKDTVTLSVGTFRENGVPMLTIDGQNICEIKERAKLFVRVSEVMIPLVKTNKNSFYLTLQKKLNNTDFE